MYTCVRVHRKHSFGQRFLFHHSVRYGKVLYQIHPYGPPWADERLQMVTDIDKGSVLLEEPVHNDINGSIVEEEVLGFGRLVTLTPKRPHNAFLMGETGDNTHGKEDSRQGGKKKVVPRGKVPKEAMGMKFLTRFRSASRIKM